LRRNRRAAMFGDDENLIIDGDGIAPDEHHQRLQQIGGHFYNVLDEQCCNERRAC
jgi:hypothetical protein